MNDPGYTELAIAIGRVEEMLKSMNEKLDKLETVNESHAESIRRHETEIAVLKERQGPRTSLITWLTGAAALIALALGILDRIFVNQ